MSRTTSFVPFSPEPEKPKTVEEQIVQYRHDYRAILQRVVTLFARRISAMSK